MLRYSLIIFFTFLSFLEAQSFGDTLRIRFDFNRKLVYLEKWRDSVFLGVIRVEPLEEYFKRSFKERFLYNFYEEAKVKRERSAVYQTGIIPVIELPTLPFLGESRIKISGEDRITFGGRRTSYTSPLYGVPGGSPLPELKMNQELRLTVTGEIGGRTKINIDHDSRRTEAKNKISVVYTGTEDEIVRKIEGGDISFGFPTTRYTGDIPARKGLFGLRTEGAFGPIDFYAVASREQSEKREVEFKGKASVKVDTFYDYEYAKYKFFILDTNPDILLKINEFQLFYDDGNPYNDIQTNAIRCLATIYPDFPDSMPVNSDERIKAGFIRLEINKDFYLRTLTILPYGEIPVIELNISVEGGNLACFYTTFDGETIGGKRYEDSLLTLKLIKKKRFDATSLLFKYNLRNIYSLGEKNIRIKQAKILRVSGSYPTEYETDGEYKGESFLKILGLDPDGDGQINFPYFQSGYGLIVFPYLYPFNSEGLSVRDSIIYFKEPLSYGEGGKYLIVIEYSTSVQEFLLGTTDIEEGSEKVYINGILVEREKDYKIDYKAGKITITNLPPDAEIKVTFEQKPLFMASAKTFGGFRAETKLFENLTLGSSFLLRSEGAYTEKPELGYEPFNKGIFSFNLSYLKDFNFLRFQTSGEVARSFQNTNTLNNAYIDDFEETVLEHSLNMEGLSFSFAPVPYFSDTNRYIRRFPKIKNPRQENYIRRDSIFGPQIGEEGRERDKYLIIEVENNLNNNPWFGICQALIRGSSIQLENYENLEMVFRIDSGDYDGKISFSLASYLEEDVPRRTKDGRIVGYNNIFDTEDKNGNNELEPDEDCGLDGVFGVDSLNIPEDDQNDDYDYYSNPLGTEKNRILNSEDIDLNGFDARGSNHFFSYTVSLNSKNVKELYNNWKVLTIPIRAFDTVIGRPNLNDIRKLAIYFHNFSKPFKMRIYSIKFTGVRWKRPRFLSREVDTLISKARIYSVSNKNTPEYTSPFKVKKDIRGMYYEASLCLEIDSIAPYDTCITEMFLTTGQDLRKYSQIGFYFHKPKNIEERSIMVYFRIGLDTSNFYVLLLPLEEKESFYKIRKVPYGEDWYEIQISLDSLPLIKTGKKREEVKVKGEPSLNNVRYYALGVCNILTSKISYNVWFNDLKVNRPKNENGLVYGVNTSVSIPNLGFNTSFNIEKQNPFFSRLTQAPIIAGNDNLNYFLNSSIDLSKIPYLSLLGFSLPLSYNKMLSFSKPYYSPSIPDLVLKDKTAEGKSGSENYSFSLRREKKSQNPFLKYGLDAFSYSFSKRFAFSNQALSIDTSNTFSQSFSYNISPDLGIKIKNEKISLFPNNISLSLSLSDNESKRRNRAKETDTFATQPKVLTKNANFSYGLVYSPISDLNIEYSCGNYFNRLGAFKSGLIKEKRTFLGVDEGFSRDIGLSYNFSLFEILEPNFSIDGSYDEGREKMRGDTYTDKRRITNDFSFSFGTDFDLPELFEKLKLEEVGDYFDVISFDYNFSRGTEYPRIDFRPGLLYQFGFSEKIPYDSSQRTKDREHSLSLSSSFKISNISLKWDYDRNWEKNFYGLSSRQGSQEIKFPALEITIGNVEKILPKLLSSSEISSKLEKRKTLSSRLAPDGSFILGERNEDISYNFSPLIGWRLNFKNQMNTTININYNKTQNYNALSNITNYNESKGFSLSYSYNFSLREGIKIPLLKKIKLTQDINFTSNFNYNLNETYYIRELAKTFLSRSNNSSLSLSFSYQLSSYTNVGLNTSYSVNRNLLKQDKTQTIDINIWVLFRF